MSDAGGSGRRYLCETGEYALYQTSAEVVDVSVSDWFSGYEQVIEAGYQ